MNPGAWARVRRMPMEGMLVRIDEVLAGGCYGATLYGTDGKAQLTGLVFAARDLDALSVDAEAREAS